MKSLILVILRKLAALRLAFAGCRIGSQVILNGFPYCRRKGSGRILIGNHVTINASRWGNWLGTPGAMILSVEDGAVLELADGAGVSSSQLIANTAIHIGRNTLVGAGCLICDSDMHEVPLGSGKPITTAPIHIGSGVFIGARSIILKGVRIGDGAVIGAGSVVIRDIPPHCIAAGNPAKVVKSQAEQES